MAQDTIKIITFLKFGCAYVTVRTTGLESSKSVCMCACVLVRVHALSGGSGGRLELAAGMGEETTRLGLFN